MDEIKPLTSLRGIAAFAVVLQHFSTTAQKLTSTTIPSLAPHGYMAVDFFFVLSGFIMCLTYLPAFQANGLKAFPAFLVKRVARIVPLNVFALVALAIFGAISHWMLKENIFFDDTNIAFDFIANLLMLQGLGIGRNLNAPSWSISTEFAAYLLFPLLIWLMFGGRRWVAITATAVSAATLTGLAMQFPRLGLAADGTGGQLIRCFTEFVMGMGAYILYESRKKGGGAAGDLEGGLLLTAAVAGLLAGVDLFVALLFPFVVTAMALNRTKIASLLSGSIPYLLGVVSFSIYLVHDPFRKAMGYAVRSMYPGGVGPVTALALAFAGSLLIVPVAWLTYICVERPGRTAIRNWAESTRVRGRWSGRIALRRGP